MGVAEDGALVFGVAEGEGWRVGVTKSMVAVGEIEGVTSVETAPSRDVSGRFFRESPLKTKRVKRRMRPNPATHIHRWTLFSVMEPPPERSRFEVVLPFYYLGTTALYGTAVMVSSEKNDFGAHFPESVGICLVARQERMNEVQEV